MAAGVPANAIELETQSRTTQGKCAVHRQICSANRNTVSAACHSRHVVVSFAPRGGVFPALCAGDKILFAPVLFCLCPRRLGAQSHRQSHPAGIREADRLLDSLWRLSILNRSRNFLRLSQRSTYSLSLIAGWSSPVARQAHNPALRDLAFKSQPSGCQVSVHFCTVNRDWGNYFAKTQTFNCQSSRSNTSGESLPDLIVSRMPSVLAVMSLLWPLLLSDKS